MPSSISSSKPARSLRDEYDERLIPMVKRPADRPFLVAVAVGFLAFFVAWNSVIRFAPSTFPQLNQAEENRARVVAGMVGRVMPGGCPGRV